MQGCELLSVAEMAEADRLAMAGGESGLMLMERAGRAVADAVSGLCSAPARILIACGPGNNGGDGLVAARILRDRGYRIAVGLLGEPEALGGDAAAMAQRWGDGSSPLTPELVARPGEVIIDALFGAGLSRPLAGAAAEIVGAINAAGKTVVAVDVPSGLNGSTGAADGPCVGAKRTVTFFRRKPGHLLLPGRALCGEVTVCDIGIPATTLDRIKPRAFHNAPALWLGGLPQPALGAHKYQRGHTVVVSGPAESTGAARLGARGALRIGSGLVTLVGSAAATAVNATHATAVMVRALASDAELGAFLSDRRRNAVLFGPGAGVGRATADTVLTVLAAPAAVVLDADALTSFTAEAGAAEVRAVGFGFVVRDPEPPPGGQALYAAVNGREAPVVLTPHEGEFKRLFGALAGSKLDRARQAAALSGAVVVLKGADTVVAAPDGRASINDNAPAWLATAGAGDVLAGFVSGLLAQGMPAFEAASAAVWLHGASAQLFGRGLIAEDLPETLPRVLASL
ncbi:MAG TPA: NAD(P)H-hydrate dehydratase [Hyphomicrobiaceae bacterium]|nr:NAD(P)H-hydrate dehydratase [Hyphomicrobiaceae bacterium]